MDGEKAPICYKEITTALRQWILPTFVSLPWGFSVFGGAASKFSSEHNNTSLRYTCFPVFSFKYGNMVNIDLQSQFSFSYVNDYFTNSASDI